MKNVILLFVLALIYCTSLSAQVNWPTSSSYVYWGSPDLNQREYFNYSLLQHKQNGHTFLNSPSTVSLRIRNRDMMDINKDRIRFLKPTQFGVSMWHASTDGKSRFYFAANGKTYARSPKGYEWRRDNDRAIFRLEDNGGLQLQTSTWHKTLDGKSRLYFAANGRTYFGSQDGYTWRDKGDRDLMYLANNGNLGIGTNNPGSWKLAVNGKIRAKEIKVETGWADFVFYDDYQLPTLEEVEQHIEEKGHLKDIPSAEEVESNGVSLGKISSKLLQKIEELTLYTIQQQKLIEDLMNANSQQQKQVTTLQDKLENLEKKK